VLFAGKKLIVPKAFPAEFRRDVVAVARKGEAPLSQIAKDFGISESCPRRGGLLRLP
jgi:transposase